MTPRRIISVLCCMESKTNRPPAGPPQLLVGVFSARRLNFTYRSFNFQSAGSNIPGCRVGKDRLQVAVTHRLTSHNRQSRKRQRQISNQTPPPPSSSSPLPPTPPSPPSSLLPPAPPHLPPTSPFSFHCGHFGSVVIVAMPTGFFPTPLMTVAW